MPIIDPPVPSQWYRHLDKGWQFQVMAIDEEGGTVEIQHFDGDLEEIDLENWYALELEPIEPPEDWTGPIDDVLPDDLGYSESDMSEADWSENLEERDPRTGRGEWPEENEGEGRRPED